MAYKRSASLPSSKSELKFLSSYKICFSVQIGIRMKTIDIYTKCHLISTILISFFSFNYVVAFKGNRFISFAAVKRQ